MTVAWLLGAAGTVPASRMHKIVMWQVIGFPPYPTSKLSGESSDNRVRPRFTSSTVQRSITVAEVAEHACQNRVGRAPEEMSLGEGNLMGPISKNLVILGLATSLGALGIALTAPFSAADVALATGDGVGGGHASGGGGHACGGHPCGGHPGGGHPGGSVAHYSGGHGHYSSHVSSHVSHGSGGHHYSTRYSGHTHTTGHTRTTNLSKTNLNKNKSNLSKSNVTDHSLKNAGQEKN